MRKFGSLGQARVRRILDAVERSGGRVLSEPDPTTAPYELTVESPDGEMLELVCYAFTASKYGQQGRPKDEHRFQVKYGSDFGTRDDPKYHEIWLDPDGRKITLFFGVGIDEDEGVFVACDPAMHNPTRFSRSVEFKTHHVEATRQSGWLGWERERSEARRQRPMPEDRAEVEALLAFTPENFFRFIQVERATIGLDPGERLLIAEQLAPVPEQPAEILTLDDVRQKLEEELGYTSDDAILRFLHGLAFRAKAALRGAAAEDHLVTHLGQVPSVTAFEKIDEDGRPDFWVEYKRRRPVHIECKNVLRRTRASGAAVVDFQRTRASKRDPCSRYYHPDEFEVLAACLHPVTKSWEYRFRSTATMDRGPKPFCPAHLHHRPTVEGSEWTGQLDQLLDEVTE